MRVAMGTTTIIERWRSHDGACQQDLQEEFVLILYSNKQLFLAIQPALLGHSSLRAPPASA
jgi:hypothetical protein